MIITHILYYSRFLNSLKTNNHSMISKGIIKVYTVILKNEMTEEIKFCSTSLSGGGIRDSYISVFLPVRQTFIALTSLNAILFT